MGKSFAYPVALLVAGSILGIGFAEAAARFFLPAPIVNQWPPLRMEADAFCGYRHVPNQAGYALSGKVHINRWGFRGKDWQETKEAGVARIALLGDSYVFGPGVDDNETFGAQLEAILNGEQKGRNRVEVLNFSASGYDLGHEIRVLERHGLRFKPDIVLLHFFLNDLLYVKSYSFYPVMFAKQEKEVSFWKWRLREWGRQSRLIMALWDVWRAQRPDEMTALIRAYVQKNANPGEGPAGEGWAFVVSQLERFHELAKTHGFEPMLVIIPTPQEMLGGRRKAAYAEFLVTQCRRLGIKPVLLLSEFRKAHRDASELLIPYDFHFSARGHRTVAEILSHAVHSNGPKTLAAADA